ncbi:CHASE domain-containing protein [Reinekea blandensis]|uniref:histidine kinase n=1 Tax=Reinekea blandensis MED297 TaxID=314283 RepID=A4BB00_9GAMM|nr:CHASE domain-containing protein [Reinekea blandensis]EAR10613.1 PAS [Reinekea sp. MED297] [Reinekea blandensis MED297]
MSMRLPKAVQTITLWIPFLAGLLLTGIACVIALNSNDQAIREHLVELADEAESSISTEFEHFQYGLRGARGVFVTAGVDNVDRAMFEDYIASRDLEYEFPGALGFGFIRRVPMETESDYLRSIRNDGAPNFEITQLAPHDLDRFIIQYIYPFAPNRQAQGLDIGSENNRRAAALDAARTNQPRLTAPITLVQADQKTRRGVLILLPVYDANHPTNTPDQRESAVVGWTYAPLVIDDVLEDLGAPMEQTTIVLSHSEDPVPFFTSDINADISDRDIFVSRTIQVLGQQWTLTMYPNRLGLAMAERWQIMPVAIIGLTLTLVLAYLMVLIRTTLSADKTLEESTSSTLESFSAFVNEPQLRSTWSAFITILLFFFLGLNYFVFRQTTYDVQTELNSALDEKVDRLKTLSNRYINDVQSIANTPPIQQLIALANNDSLDQTGRAYQQSSERLEDIFRSYMLAAPEVYQVRLILAKDRWTEAVKVQRGNSQLISLSGDQLQSKQSEPYISATLAEGPGDVYVSSINLNREFGMVEYPHRPMWRFATPVVTADNRPFGIVIINVTPDNYLSSLSEPTHSDERTFITNVSNDFILHPSQSRTFAFEHGTPYRWSDEFTPDSNWASALNSELTLYSSTFGDVWMVSESIDFETRANSNFLTLYVARASTPVLQTVLIRVFSVFTAFAIVSFIGVLFQFIVWRNAARKRIDTYQQFHQQQQEKDRKLFKSLLESAPDPTFIVDEQGIIQLVNRRSEQMFGYERNELLGQNIDTLLPERFKANHPQQRAAFIQNPTRRLMGVGRDLFARCKDGTEFPVEVTLGVVPLEDRTLVSAALRDITERKNSEEKLQHAITQAMSSAEAKSAFLANTSHEIRTPLNAIIGLSHLLDHENLTENQHLLVDKIQLSGQSLLNIINDVLDLSKIEANEVDIESTPVNLRELIEDTLNVHRMQADLKGLEVALNIDPKVPNWVETDKTRLKQILDNLFSNALKFTSEGSISLRCHLVEETDRATVRFEVIDTGIGISEKAQQQLFEPFTQADVSTTRKYGGTGLGLSIILKLVYLMEGRLGLESEEGQGSRFWFELPFKTLSDNELDNLSESAGTLFIMIAEDSKDDAQQLQKITRALGWRSSVVNNGVDMLADIRLRAEQNLRLPDAVLVDWNMPELDGFETIRKMREMISKADLPAVIMVSAYEQLDPENPTDEKLIDAFLQKPIEPSALFNVVNTAVTDRTGNAEKVLKSTKTDLLAGKWLENYSILVVEDSPINQLVVSQILSRNGASVVVKDNGEDAIDYLSNHPEAFDAILMDVQMPGIDGLETTQRIRNHLNMTDIPIIALTAGALVEERKKALDAGMNDFLTKPIEPERLIQTLRHHVGDKQTPDIADAQVQGVAEADDDNWPVIEGLDMTQAKTLLMDSPSLFRMTLTNLVEEHQNLSSPPDPSIDEPSHADARKALAGQVHKLKSVSGMVGAQTIQAIATKTETALRDESEPALPLLTELSEQLHRLINHSAPFLNDVSADYNQTLSEAQKENSGQPVDLTALIDKLNDRDLSVLNDIDAYDEPLRSLIGSENMTTLRAHLGRLAFQDIIQMLQPYQTVEDR